MQEEDSYHNEYFDPIYPVDRNSQKEKGFRIKSNYDLKIIILLGALIVSAIVCYVIPFIK